MAHYAAKQVGNNSTFELGAADGSRGEICRWRLHVTQITGTATIKAHVQGNTTTAIAANVVTTVGSTTTGSTITATGLYDLDAAGLSLIVSMSNGGSDTITFDACAVVG